MSSDLDNTGAQFPTTHVSLLDLAQAGSPTAYRDAWEAFFRAYWPPLYAWLRRTGSAAAEAQDLVQDLFVEGLDGRLLSGYDRSKGRLRHYLIGCLRHRRQNAQRHERARPDRIRLPVLDAEGIEACLMDSSIGDPQEAFDREWASQVLTRAIAALQAAIAARGDALSARVLAEWVLSTDRPAAPALAGALGVTVEDLYTRASRLRRTLIGEVEAQVRSWSAGAASVGEEVREVLRCLTM